MSDRQQAACIAAWRTGSQQFWAQRRQHTQGQQQHKEALGRKAKRGNRCSLAATAAEAEAHAAVIAAEASGNLPFSRCQVATCALFASGASAEFAGKFFKVCPPPAAADATCMCLSSAVVLARDKFMKEGGAMYPSQARMFLAPIRTQASAQRVNDFQVGTHMVGGGAGRGGARGPGQGRQLGFAAVIAHLPLGMSVLQARVSDMVFCWLLLCCRTQCTAGLSSSRK